MQGANYIADRIYISFGKICAGMGAITLKSKIIIVVLTDADHLISGLYRNYVPGRKDQIKFRIGYFYSLEAQGRIVDRICFQ